MSEITNESEPLLLRGQINSTTYVPWDPRRAKIAGTIILFSVMLERLAYYALVMNLFLYLNKGQTEVQSWNAIQAMTAVFVLHGIAYMSAPLGGWLSDSYLGRFKTIILGYLLYIAGYILLTILSANALVNLGCDLKSRDSNETNPVPNKTRNHLPNSFIMGLAFLEASANSGGLTSPPCKTHVYIILTLIGLAVGIVRSNIPAFGAEQVRDGGKTTTRRFFTWYYWCVNIGSIVGVGVLSFVAQDFTSGFTFAYGTATLALFSAMLVFSAGRKFYIIHRPQGSLLTDLICIPFEGAKGKCKKVESLQSSPLIRRKSFIRTPSPTWLDYAKTQFGGCYHETTVEDVRKVGMTVLFFAVLLPYWLVYFQMSTSFQAQGLHMRIFYGKAEKAFSVPAAWLTLFDQAFVLVLVPLLNGLVYPYLDKKRLSPSNLERMMFGMLFSVLASAFAGILEHFRLKTWHEGFRLNQNISGTTYDASDFAIWWQIPQYCMVGAAEILAGVAGLEFAYSSSPKTFQGLIMGLYSAVEGIGSFLGVSLVVLTNAWQLNWIREDDEFNEGRLDLFYYTLSIIQTATLLVFICVSFLRNQALEQDPDGDRNLEGSMAVSVGSLDIPANLISSHGGRPSLGVRRGLDTHNSV